MDVCRCTESSSDAWECPALAKAGSLLLPLVLQMWLCARVGGLSSCDRREGEQCLPSQPRAGPAEAAGAAAALGRGCTIAQAGARAAQRALPWKRRGEAEEQRAPRFSSWLGYQVLFQCIFHPQSSQSLVEIPAFAVVQLDQILLPCGQIWLAHCHMDHTNQRLLSKDSGIFISYLGLHSQLLFLRDYFYSCQQNDTERHTKSSFFPFCA